MIRKIIVMIEKNSKLILILVLYVDNNCCINKLSMDIHGTELRRGRRRGREGTTANDSDRVPLERRRERRGYIRSCIGVGTMGAPGAGAPLCFQIII